MILHEAPRKDYGVVLVLVLRELPKEESPILIVFEQNSATSAPDNHVVDIAGRPLTRDVGHAYSFSRFSGQV